MNLLMSIATYIEEKGHGSLGSDLFCGFMPHSAEGVLVLSHIPISINRYTRLRTGSFQLVARGPESDLLDTKLRTISNDLRSEGLILDDIKFSYILPRHEPLLFPRSESSMIEGTVNFDCSFMAL